MPQKSRSEFAIYYGLGCILLSRKRPLVRPPISASRRYKKGVGIEGYYGVAKEKGDATSEGSSRVDEVNQRILARHLTPQGVAVSDKTK